jgi:phospholipid/cholesterol/gamma-HCH transport system substrate-binding protein
MSRNVIETVMGAVVLVIAAVFLFFAYSTSQVRAVSGYDLTARFDRIEGIREGGDVRISGIKVGNIVSQTLDPTTFLAVVKMTIDPAIKLPSDSVAEILSSGLLGDKFLALVPGAADDILKPGGVIKFTQSPMSLENLIGQYIFSQGQSKKGDGDADKPK